MSWLSTHVQLCLKLLNMAIGDENGDIFTLSPQRDFQKVDRYVAFLY